MTAHNVLVLAWRSLNVWRSTGVSETSRLRDQTLDGVWVQEREEGWEGGRVRSMQRVAWPCPAWGQQGSQRVILHRQHYHTLLDPNTQTTIPPLLASSVSFL